MSRHSSGFTTIEIVIVIGIIVVLVGILFVGVNHVSNTARVRSTNVTLGNLNGMLIEYEVTGGRLGELEEEYDDEGWNPLPAPGDVTLTDDEAPGTGDRDSEQVHLTHEVMEMLIRIPANRSILEQLPPEQLMRDEADDDHPPILLDGWRNPIIFVPSEGLWDVWEGEVYRDEDNPIRSPDRRPFFASAGPSGDFQNGEDNLYSFEN